MELPNSYKYLDKIALWLIDKKKWKNKIFDEYNLSGARLSGKTTSITIELAKLMAISLSYGKKVAVYAARKQVKSVPELVQEIKIALDDIGVPYRLTTANKNSSFPYFRFQNDSFIQVIGITNSTTPTNLKGLAKALGYNLSIDWIEEANECEKKDFQDLRFSIRGSKKHISITSCNPDLIHQDHIAYLHTNAPFDINYLKAYGQQFTPYEMVLNEKQSKYILNHYTTWKVNPFLNQEAINRLEELLITDPVKAVSWYYGYPGALEGTIFGAYLGKVRHERDYTTYTYLAGCDIGYSEKSDAHPTTMMLISTNETFNRFDVISEYFHKNAESKYKTMDEIQLELVTKAKDWYVSYNMRFPLVIKVDSSGGSAAYIDTLNRIVKMFRVDPELPFAEKNAYNNIFFEPVDKTVWFTKDRIEITQILITTQKLGFNKDNVPNLVKQMEQMIYKENRSKQTYKVEMLDLNDDCWDAMMYAIMAYAKSTIESVNPLLRKGHW